MIVAVKPRTNPTCQGQCTFEMVRVPELEAKGLNPWRVTKQKIILAFETGNMALLA